jgi:hypothetical protein
MRKRSNATDVDTGSGPFLKIQTKGYQRDGTGIQRRDLFLAAFAQFPSAPSAEHHCR